MLAARTVFITGAARGIGEHIARQAAAKGAIVFLAGLEPQRLAAVAGQVGGGWAECDVTDQAALANAVQRAVDMTGGIDYVVANAGVINLGTMATGDIEAFARTVDVNLTGVMRTVSATLPHVQEARGYYLLLSSSAAFAALPGMAAYCAAKAGVEHFGNVLRMELAPSGVAVGTAHPGWVDTDLLRDVRADLPTFVRAQPKLPWPFNRTVPVEQCASALVRAMERRSRRSYVPRPVALAQSLRTVVNGRLGQAIMIRASRAEVGRLEEDVRALGRSFGVHSAGVHSAGVHSEGVHGAGVHGAGQATPPRHAPVATPQPAPVRSAERATLNFTRLGSGEPLVLIHGIGHRWQAWEPVMDELARHHEVIAIDLPGFGRSPVPAGGMPRTIPELVARLQEEFATLRLDRFHVAGNSLGGGLALELAAAGASASATALSPAGFYTPAEAWRAMMMLTGLRTGAFAPAPLVRGVMRQPWMRDLALGGVVQEPSRLDLDRMLGDAVSLRGAKGYWRTAMGLRRYAFSGSPEVPVTVAWGDRDRVLRPAQAQRAREALPGARHVSLPHCGHVPMSDKPAMVARLILETTGALVLR